MADTFVLGKDCKAYSNAGTFGSPTWTLQDQIVDVHVDIDNELAEGSRRAGGGLRQWAACLTDLPISFKMIYNPGNTGFSTVWAAAFARTEIDMIFLDGLQASGSHTGPRMSATFAKAPRKEELNGIVNVEFQVKAGMGFVPLWFTGAA